MVNIHLSQKNKTRLDNAIKFYCKEKQLPVDFGQKISYDFIVGVLLDEANQ